MLSNETLSALLFKMEADNVERTCSVRNSDKIGEAICAFANDLPGRKETGVLFLGANDDGTCSELNVSEQMLQTLMDFGTDGRIIPLPSMTVRKVILDQCELVVIEVQPSEDPPVKYRGRVCVRRGPRHGFATSEEERRLTEKRRWGNLSYDQHSITGATLDDLDLERFKSEYLPAAIAPDVLKENNRDRVDQLRALRFAARDNVPTVTGILVIGKNPRQWIPGGYIQFVRYPGTEIDNIVRDQKEIDGPLVELFRRVDDIIEANISVAADLSRQIEEQYPDYPIIALQETIRNAVIHRNYENANAPVRLTWFDDRVEIVSPGGPYGNVNIDNFGKPGVTDYRNPAVAEAAKALGFLQKFGSGIPRAEKALKDNGNPPLHTELTESFVSVTIRKRV